ncbi:MAG: hypothetical protein VKL97_05225 [Cyanobacteriota bacterium]|nr:hypothetical protein [Cyanobacteriota bacterium]
MGSQNQGGSGGGVLLSAFAGAAIGAAGLAWWLLSEAERRRQMPARQRALRLSRLQDDSIQDVNEARSTGTGNRDLELHDKVHELNQAIDDVRRQLEGLGSR